MFLAKPHSNALKCGTHTPTVDSKLLILTFLALGIYFIIRCRSLLRLHRESIQPAQRTQKRSFFKPMWVGQLRSFAHPPWYAFSNCSTYSNPRRQLFTLSPQLIEKAKVEQNCHSMIEAAKEAGVGLRVHVKTHKTIEGALLQLGGSLSSIIVSTLAEARYFAHSGLFNDVCTMTAERIL